MKKFLVITLVLAMLLPLVGIAEEKNALAYVDLNALTDDELIELCAQIEAEMTNRDILHMHLYIGEYIVGEDIDAGRYVISAVDVYDSSIGPYIQYTIYELNTETKEWEQLSWESVDEVGQKVSFTLKEGQKLRVYNGEWEIVSYKSM